MRWINLAVIVIFAAALLIFAAQNFQTVTVYFLTFKMSAPLAILSLSISSAWSPEAVMRQAFEGSRSL
jgi:putative membrane protein